MNRKKQLAFSLLELMIVIAIIGILVTVSIPSYKNYTRRAHYTEIIQAIAPYKIGVEECFQTTGSLDQCSAGQYGIPPSIPEGKSASLVDTLTVDKDGIIIAIPKSKFGINPEDDYILKPDIQYDQLIWQAEGGAISAGYAR